MPKHSIERRLYPDENPNHALCPLISVILATLFILFASFSGAQQPPTLTLLNADTDGDNEVTLFDFGLLVDAFGSMPGDPTWNPDADLDGDDEVTLFDFGILNRNFGLIGAEEFAGSAQSASGNWSATLRVELGDWTAQTSREVFLQADYSHLQVHPTVLRARQALPPGVGIQL